MPPMFSAPDWRRLLQSADAESLEHARTVWEALTEAARSPDDLLIFLQDPQLPQGVLERFVQTGREDVRARALERLLQWESGPVTAATTPEELTAALRSPRREERLAAARIVTPYRDPLLAALDNEQDEHLTAALRAHPLVLVSLSATPAPLLALLAKHPQPEVRLGVARHGQTRLDTLAQLQSDANPEVRSVAAGRLLLPRQQQARGTLGSAPDIGPPTAMQAGPMAEIPEGAGFEAEEIEGDEMTDDSTTRQEGVMTELINQELSSGSFQAMSERTDTPPVTLTQLAASPNPDIRQAVALNPRTPPEVLGELMHDQSPLVQQAAVTRVIQESSAHPELWALSEDPSTPSPVLALLAQSANCEIRLEVAGHPNVTTEILRSLMLPDQPDERLPSYELAWVAWTAFQHPLVTPEMALDVLGQPAFPLGALERGVHLPEAQLAVRALQQLLAWPDRDQGAVSPADADDWFRSDEWDKRLACARTYLVPEVHHLEQLMTDADEDVRAAAAAHPLMLAMSPQTPPELLEVLAPNDDWQVGVAVASHPAASHALLEQFSEDSDEDIRAAAFVALATRPEEPGDGLIDFAERATAPEVLSSLAQSAHWQVLEAVASNSHAPVDVLAELASRPASRSWTDVRVSWNALQHPSFPAERRPELVRQGELPLGVLERLATHDDDALAILAVRQLLVWEDRRDTEPPQDWRLSEAWTERLAYARSYVQVYRNDLEAMLEREEDEDVLAALHAHPLILAYATGTPPAVLELLARSEDWEVRQGVAGHPNTPAQVRERLLTDEDKAVRQVAQELTVRPPSPPEVATDPPAADVTVAPAVQGTSNILPLAAHPGESSVDDLPHQFPAAASRLSASPLPASDPTDAFRMKLFPAVDDQALCAEITLAEPTILSLWPTCRNQQGAIAALVYPAAPAGEVNLSGRQKVLLMFDVQGRYSEGWTVELQGRIQLGEMEFGTASTPLRPSGQESPPVHPIGNPPAAAADPVTREPSELERLAGGVWPAALPRPDTSIEPVLLHVLRHQWVSLLDLDRWMNREGLSRSVRRAFFQYIDQAASLGWPFIIRNEAYQPPRLEVQMDVLGS